MYLLSNLFILIRIDKRKTERLIWLQVDLLETETTGKICARAHMCFSMCKLQTQASQETALLRMCTSCFRLLYCVLIPTEGKQKPLALCFNTGQLLTVLHLSRINSRRRSVHTPSLLRLRNVSASVRVQSTWHCNTF